MISVPPARCDIVNSPPPKSARSRNTISSSSSHTAQGTTAPGDSAYLRRRLDELRGQRFPPPCDPAFAVSHHAAGSQDERSNLLRPSHVAGAEPLDREQQNLLREVVGSSFVPQMPAAVQPHARGEAAIQLGLLHIGRSRRAVGDSARER